MLREGSGVWTFALNSVVTLYFVWTWNRLWMMWVPSWTICSSDSTNRTTGNGYIHFHLKCCVYTFCNKSEWRKKRMCSSPLLHCFHFWGQNTWPRASAEQPLRLMRCRKLLLTLLVQVTVESFCFVDFAFVCTTRVHGQVDESAVGGWIPSLLESYDHSGGEEAARVQTQAAVFWERRTQIAGSLWNQPEGTGGCKNNQILI